MANRVIVTGVESRAAASTGGQLLRALREARGRTQLWVEAEAELGTGYLQRVESGRVAQPSRATVERVLAVLTARHGDWQEILDRYGYTVGSPLPSDDERAWATSVCQRDLDGVAFPAYALDCRAQLVAWNSYLPALLGLPPETPMPSGMTQRSLLYSWFDPATLLGAILLDRDTALASMARALRYELQRYRQEAWPKAFLEELCAALPEFRAAWNAVGSEPSPINATRARVPFRLQPRGEEPLTFRLAAEPLADDPRFRVVYAFPADPATIRWCERVMEQTR